MPRIPLLNKLSDGNRKMYPKALIAAARENISMDLSTAIA